MEEQTESNNNERSEEENNSLHIYVPECNCPECRKCRRHYVQILDMDRFINGLNDWD